MKVQTIMNVELSSICDNVCPYCPAKDQKQHRQTGYMEFEVVNAVVKWINHFERNGTQTEVNLFGIGEPLLHPEFLPVVKFFISSVYPSVHFHMNTNGNSMTVEIAEQLFRWGIREIDITGHDAKAAARTIRIFQDVGIDYKVSFDFILSPNNWAGQVDWFEPRYPTPNPCPWISKGQVMVMSNGDITTCCMDSKAQGVIGTVFDEVNELEVKPYSLCTMCHHTI